MDNLTYTDTGNQLTRVDDAVADNANELGFRESVETANEYTYDGNGSMNKDLNKSISTITYNHLNLARRVYKSGADSVVVSDLIKLNHFVSSCSFTLNPPKIVLVTYWRIQGCELNNHPLTPTFCLLLDPPFIGRHIP